MAPGGEEREGSGRDGGEWEAQPGCENFCWATSLPDFITALHHYTLPNPAGCPEEACLVLSLLEAAA